MSLLSLERSIPTNAKVGKYDITNAVDRLGGAVGIMIANGGLRTNLSLSENDHRTSCSTWKEGSLPA